MGTPPHITSTADVEGVGGEKINTDMRTLKVKGALRIRGAFALFLTARDYSRSLSNGG